MLSTFFLDPLDLLGIFEVVLVFTKVPVPEVAAIVRELLSEDDFHQILENLTEIFLFSTYYITFINKLQKFHCLMSLTISS